MKITIKDDYLDFKNPKLYLREFPDIYGKFINGDLEETDKDTMIIEAEGEQLIKSGLSDVRRVNDFVLHVFKWGGRSGNRVCGMLYKNYGNDTEAKIADMVKDSAMLLSKNHLMLAIGQMFSLKGIGISFGSKILRMLSPQQAGVYDSVLEKQFSYKNIPGGYAEFCDDCKKVADKLNQCGIKHPLRNGGIWFIADVEAVIYFKFRRLNDMLKKTGR